ncbi:MAG: aminoglycoside phosphotransferase family protein [Deltaproteobacteria bacterium]|nr:aminoglycoside phosphotransferase family protein [Deltaproteobacteria bacterium]
MIKPSFLLRTLAQYIFASVQFASSRLAGKEPAGFTFCAHRLTHLKPVKAVCYGNGLNKAGRMVLKGRAGRQSVKLYEAAGLAHADFICTVGSKKWFGHFFPDVIGVQGHWIAAEWAKGKRMVADVKTLHWLAEIMVKLHQVPASVLPEAGFDYWHDFVLPRFKRAMAFAGETDLVMTVRKSVEAVWLCDSVLMHPDLTPANVIHTADKGFCIIDNELLTTGGIPLLDVCNTCKALAPAQAVIYAEAYFRACPEDRRQISPDMAAALEAVWLARIVGSAFVAGNASYFLNAISQYRAGQSLLPAGLNSVIEAGRL